MANVMNLANVRNKVSRNAFDLSYRNITSCCVGQLIPFFCKEVMPSDNVRLKTTWFTRTVPVNTAAYTRIREHIDYFFVPYHLLWRFSEQCFTQMSDNYQHAYQDMPSAQSILNGTHLPTFTLDDLDNFLKPFKQATTDQQNLLKDDGGNNAIVGTYRLLDALGYGIKQAGNNVSTPYNAFRLLAYQKIYSDYYRFDQWEESNPNCFNVDYYLPSMGNLCFHNYSQSYSSLTLTDSKSLAYLHNTPFTLRYANYPKDLFMGLLPSPQYGGTAYAPIDFDGKTLDFDVVAKSANTDPVLRLNPAGNKYVIATDRPIQNAHLTLSDSQPDNTPALNVLELRKAQAVQKWKEITNCHKKSYKAQIEAHYGTNVSEVASDMVTYIGGADQTISIDEVINNNLTNEEQASIHGKGTSGGSGYIDFQVKNYHGIIMGIYHAQPLADYSSDAIDPFNMKTDFTDYAIPEFDKLGMQPVPYPQLDANSENMNLYQAFNKTLFVGYAPRYYEYKISKDLVSESVRNYFTPWQASLTMQKLMTPFNTTAQPSITYKSFKIKPWQLNEIFAVVNGNPSAESWSNMSADQLLINFNNTCQMVRPLDFNGLPY